MIRYIYIFLLLLLSIVTGAQAPGNQFIGSPTTQVLSRGPFATDSAFVYKMNFADTTAANRGWIKGIAGAAIRAGNTIWLRNSTATAWINQSGGLGTLDTLPYPPWVVVQDLAGNNYKSQLPRVFNVKDYGAKGDGVTNDQTAIQNTIDTCYVHGGGIVYFPNGIYILSGALVTSVSGTNPNSQLYIPLTDSTGPMFSIVLRGETPPSFVNSGLISLPVNSGGVVIQSTIRGSGTQPAILGSPYYNSGFSFLNNTEVHIENINFRNRSKTGGGADTANTMCGINFNVIGNTIMRNVRVDIQSNIFNSSQPASGTVGIIWPGVSNSAFIRGENILCTGYDVGMIINEHMDGSNFVVSGNNYGIESFSQSHASNLTRVLAQWNIKNIVLDGAAYLKVEEYASEHYEGAFGAKWYTFQYDVYQVSGTPRLDITYWVVVSGTGPVIGDWTTNMTQNINAVVLGGVSTRYIQNTFGSTTPQSNSEYIVSGNAIVGGKLGVGLTQNEQKTAIHVRESSVPRITAEQTSAGHLIVAAATGGFLQFNKSSVFDIIPDDSILDVTSTSKFRIYGTSANTMIGTVTSDIGAQLGVINRTSSQPAFKTQYAGGQSSDIVQLVGINQEVDQKNDGSLVVQFPSGGFVGRQAFAAQSLDVFNIAQRYSLAAAADVSYGPTVHYVYHAFGPTRNFLTGDMAYNQADINAQLGTINATAGQTAFKVIGASSQSAPLAEFQNSSASTLAKIGKTGGIFGKDSLQVTGLATGPGTKAVRWDASTGNFSVADTSSGGGGGLSGFTTFGSTPNANGGSVSGSNIILQPADLTHPGGLSITTQGIKGQKTFNDETKIGATDQFDFLPDFGGAGEAPSGVLFGSATTGSISFLPSIQSGTAGLKTVLLYYSAGAKSAVEVANQSSGFSHLLLMKSGGNASIGNASPDGSALLDMTSTTQGLLPPRMTTTQKNAISSPAEGLIVYDTTLHKLCVFTGTVWETITSL